MTDKVFQCVQAREQEYLEFLKTCIKKVEPSAWDIKNKAGISLRSFIQEHGSEELKKFMEETEHEHGKETNHKNHI